MPRSSRPPVPKRLCVPGPQDRSIVVDLTTKRPFQQIGVSISLKHYRRETQCFSDWKIGDLKRFGQLLEKLRGLTMIQLLQNTRLCERHGEQKKAARFGSPADIAADAAFYELKVDPANKCRVHGVFDGSIFHLVYLDSQHEAFPFGR